MTIADIQRLVPVTRGTLANYIAEGKFPAPDKTMPRGIRLWRWATVKAWLEQ